MTLPVCPPVLIAPSYPYYVQGRKRVTIKDVARAAGVSPTTVSHALNGKGVVRQATIDRIRAVASEIGYTPNAMARGLRHPKMGLIALAIRPFEALDSFIPPGVDYFLRIAGFAALTAMEHGYTLMIVDDPSKADSPVSSQSADAYIVVEPYGSDPVLTHLLQLNVPIVTLGADIDRPASFTTMDLRALHFANEGLRHLIEAGARNIAFVMGTDRNAWNLESRDAYLEWCVQVRQEPLIAQVAEADGEEAGDSILDQLFDPAKTTQADGIYCLMGRHASGIARSAQARGIQVPTDLLVLAGSVATQNMTMSPTVSGFDPRPEVLAQRAVEAAVRLIEGEHVDSPFLAPSPVLHVRQSTTR